MVELLSWKLFPTLAPSDKTIEESQAAVEAALGMTTPTPAK
jgi:hypothetical protein